MNYCLDGDFVQYSDIYGRIDINSKLYDDSQELGGKEDIFLQYLIKKIKIFSNIINKKEIISGIQLTYQKIRTKEMKDLSIRLKNNIKSDQIDIFELKSGEYLTNFFVRFSINSKYIYQLGFETNKKRKILKGCEFGEDKKIITNGKENIILGTFGYFSEQMDSFGILYANIIDYIKKYYIGYFELKLILKKNQDFKNKIESNIKNLSEADKCLFKTSLLPDAVFNEIMKFCIF